MHRCRRAVIFAANNKPHSIPATRNQVIIQSYGAICSALIIRFFSDVPNRRHAHIWFSVEIRHLAVDASKEADSIIWPLDGVSTRDGSFVLPEKQMKIEGKFLKDSRQCRDVHSRSPYTRAHYTFLESKFKQAKIVRARHVSPTTTTFGPPSFVFLVFLLSPQSTVFVLVVVVVVVVVVVLFTFSMLKNVRVWLCIGKIPNNWNTHGNVCPINVCPCRLIGQSDTMKWLMVLAYPVELGASCWLHFELSTRHTVRKSFAL